MSTTASTTAIIGAGVMGETLLSGLIRAGRPVSELLVGEKRPERHESAQRQACAIHGPASPGRGLYHERRRSKWRRVEIMPPGAGPPPCRSPR